jgi:hypothetical protein
MSGYRLVYSMTVFGIAATCISILKIDIKELGEILNLKFVYFLTCNVVDASMQRPLCLVVKVNSVDIETYL